MPSLFQPSTRIASAAMTEIADSAGASSDPEMVTRAGHSLGAALKYYNGKVKWRWLETEANPITIIGPFDVTGISASAGQTSALAPNGTSFKVDDWLAMSGLVVGTRISATGTAAGPVTSLGFTTTISASIGTGVQVVSATGNRDFYDCPSDIKSPYSAVLLVAQRPLRFGISRIYDRTTPQPFTASIPDRYDLFSLGSKGKLWLKPSPNAADVLDLKYYRRMTIVTATNSSATLDIPDEYDDYVLAFAKWHFLTDKGEGRSEQANTWLAFAKEGLQIMLNDQNQEPDQDLQFVPGHVVRTWPAPNQLGFTQTQAGQDW
jgi:hypothetical protein